MNAGLNPIKISLSSANETNWQGKPLHQGDVYLRLYWESKLPGFSSSYFNREPIPFSAFWYDPDVSGVTHYSELHKGRNLFAEKNCIKCHTTQNNDLLVNGMPELSYNGPSFDNIGERYKKDWIAKWINKPSELRHQANMPIVFSSEDSELQSSHIAKYLATLKEKSPDEKIGFKADINKGEAIFHAYGCISCHATPGKNSEDKLNRISLDYIQSKWYPEALKNYLLNPSKYNDAIKMPNMQLKEQEAKDLSLYLIDNGNKKFASINHSSEGDEQIGKNLLYSSGCMNCHVVENQEIINYSTIDFNSLSNSQWISGCVSQSKSERQNAPNFEFSENELNYLLKFKEKHFKTIFKSNRTYIAERQYNSLKCNSCHQMNGVQSTWETITSKENYSFTHEGLAKTMGIDKIWEVQERPNLSVVGAKLKTDWMTNFIAGKIDKRPRGGLIAKMPAYEKYAKNISEGLSMLHGFGANDNYGEQIFNDNEIRIIGEELTSIKGYSCVTCHGVGDVGAKGGIPVQSINFKMVPQRLRKIYYHRFMINPQRIIYGTSMPKYTIEDGTKTWLDSKYEGDSYKQFDSIWEYMNSISNQ